MRILHVTNSPDRGATPGIVKSVVDLAIGQRARGSEVMIAIDRQEVFTEPCREHGISIVVHDALANRLDIVVHDALDRRFGTEPSPMPTMENSIKGFIECLKQLNPDIIHCHSERAAWIAVMAGNQVNIPCVYTGDGLSRLPNLLERGQGRRLQLAVICITAASFDQLKAAAPEMAVYFVQNGVKAAPSTRGQQAVANNSPNMIMVGSLIQRKGVDIAILAMVELRRRLGRDCPVLNIYGDGDRREYLTEMTAVLELNDIVRFHGFEHRILERCPSTDILIMTSRWEAGPLVVLEAMSRGMPIVATDVGNVTNMLPDQRYGRVIRPDSMVALAEAIESVLANIADGQFDPDLIIQRYRSHYSIEKWAERIEAVYKQILPNNSVVAQEA